MNKYFIILLIAAFFFASFGLTSIAAPHAVQSAAAFDGYSFLTLSDREIFIPCKLGYVPTESCPDKTAILVDVRGNIYIETDEEIEITSNVSGGRFFRKGKHYEWDFSGVEKPGVYTLKVVFVDSYGKKYSSTETITVRTCDCPNDDYLKNSASPSPTPSVEIEKIDLDREEIFSPCPPGLRPLKNEAAGDGVSSVQVKTSVVNPQNDELVYHYTVSGGRIKGKGESVSWDLSGARPGTYTITVGIGDGSKVYDETQTKTIQVKDCLCITADVCPVLDVSTPKDSVKAGETIAFKANLSGGTFHDVTYNWAVSLGEIIEGQGTPNIKVKTMREMAGSSLTATVQIDSPGMASICSRTASAAVSITK